MDCDKNHSEFRVNVISLLTVYVKREICEWKFPLFFVILSEKLANLCVISCEISKITGIGREQDFTI